MSCAIKQEHTEAVQRIMETVIRDCPEFAEIMHVIRQNGELTPNVDEKFSGYLERANKQSTEVPHFRAALVRLYNIPADELPPRRRGHNHRV